MRIFRDHGGCVILLVALAVSSTPAQRLGQRVDQQTQRTWAFESDQVRFSNAFPGARLSDCQRLAPHEYRLVIRPENQPVNNSAWYAFRVDVQEAATLTVHLSTKAAATATIPASVRMAGCGICLPRNDTATTVQNNLPR